jgi:hypothetical protein
VPPRLTARRLFVSGLALTAIAVGLALVTDGWLALIFQSADLPHAIAGTLATLPREICMTLGLVLVGVSFLSPQLEPPNRDEGDETG